MKHFFDNGLKGLLTLLTATVLFIGFLSFFPLIGSITTKNFPLGSVLLDMFNLLVILAAISIPLGFFIGLIAGRLKRRRILFLSLFGLLLYWIIVLTVVLVLSKSDLSLNLFAGIISLSVWAMLAYSFYALPFLMAAVFLIEKWTRRK